MIGSNSKDKLDQLTGKESYKQKLIAERRLSIAVLAIFSLFYFTDVCLRASEKFFWYDELFTLYFARLPDIHSLWRALTSGIDFNPPLFYLLTRWCNLLFGESTIWTRLPEMLGFWLFSLCLFQFVRRRSGFMAGVCALLLPMVTEAYFYAFEARPHAIVLGFCGLALLFWQMAVAPPRLSFGWLSAFAGALFSAFMMHCYAILIAFPFGIAALVRARQLKKIEAPIWVALILPAAIASLSYVPLLLSYRKLTSASTFGQVTAAGWSEVEHFYELLLTPCILVLLAALFLFALDAKNQFIGWVLPPESFNEVCLSLAFVALPAFGVALAKVVSGPFFHRYFLSALAGVCILIGFGAGLRKGRTWSARVLVAVLVFFCSVNFFRLVNDRMQGKGEPLTEPSSHLALSTTPGQPLARYSLLSAGPSSLPIAVLSPFDFIYLVHYAPALKARLYYATPSASSFTYVGFARLLQCCPTAASFNQPVLYQRFVMSHPQYLVYGDMKQESSIALLGAPESEMNSFLVDDHQHFLAQFSRRFSKALPIR